MNLVLVFAIALKEHFPFRRTLFFYFANLKRNYCALITQRVHGLDNGACQKRLLTVQLLGRS